jgi:hypothetical protein
MDQKKSRNKPTYLNGMSRSEGLGCHGEPPKFLLKIFIFYLFILILFLFYLRVKMSKKSKNKRFVHN